MAIICSRRHMAIWIAMAYLNEDVGPGPKLLQLIPDCEFIVDKIDDTQAEIGNVAVADLLTESSVLFEEFVIGDEFQRKALEERYPDLHPAAVVLDTFFSWLEERQTGNDE